MVHADDLLERLLRRRGIAEDEVSAFLHPDYEQGLHDPMKLPDMEHALTRLSNAIQKQERIVIYGDYDADGIPAAVILHDVLNKIGYTNFSVYIPDRHAEGYGLHIDAIEQFHATDATLIIAVDVGTVSGDAIKWAKEKGIDTIILDHHEPNGELPDAVALVNPKRADSTYPFNDLCAAGLAYKFAQAFFLHTNHTVPVGWEKWLLDMVAIATISDMVSLVGENRVLVHYGLHVLRKNRRPGLRELFRQLRMNVEHLTEDDIGFMIIPRINAASRMDHPELALNLLTSSTRAEASDLARTLSKINDERKTLVATITKQVKRKLVQQTLGAVIVIGNPSWRVGVLGLIASKLSEEYARPAFVWGREGTGVIKGSCRSQGDVSVVALMKQVEDHFISYGGHEQAGGFSVTTERIHTLELELHRAYDVLQEEVTVVQPDEGTDAELRLQDIQRAYRVVEQLAPFGIGNPKPLFSFSGLIVDEVRYFGKQKNHLELHLRDQDGATGKAISFFTSETSVNTGDTVDLSAAVEASWFRGFCEYRLRIVSIKVV